MLWFPYEVKVFPYETQVVDRMTEEWKEREGGSNIWLPKEKGEELKGVVKECIEEGMYGKNWIIENDDGTVMTPSHKVLQNRLYGIKTGANVKIVYEGEEPPAVRGQHPTKMYKVFTKGD